MKKIPADKLPKKMLAAISKRQRSYIDEFEFFDNKGEISVYYGGEYLTTWFGESFSSE